MRRFNVKTGRGPSDKNYFLEDDLDGEFCFAETAVELMRQRESLLALLQRFADWADDLNEWSSDKPGAGTALDQLREDARQCLEAKS